MTEPAATALNELWRTAGGDLSSLSSVTLGGAEPALPSVFAVGSLAAATIAASALAAAELHRQRSGVAQTVSVDIRHASAEFRSERYLRLTSPLPPSWDPLAGLYRTRDARWVRVHTNFAHHRAGLVALLGCVDDRDAVQAALMQWDGEAFEDAAAAHDLVATMTRSPAEWARHSQGRAVATLPILEIDRIGDAPPQPLPPSERPLAGVRVLDLTRIIAGPVAGRCLAAHGADVLNVTCARLPSIPTLVIDTGRGKRTASLDLATPGDAATLLQLVREADVFVQGYRPGGVAALGFSDAALAQERPGIIVADLSAYSHLGPWSGRRGFDSLTQNANGLNWEEAAAASTDGRVDRPRELPAQALDHAAGYVLAFGIMMALGRRQREGGSWRVRTSLAQMGHWLQSMPRIPDGQRCADLTPAEIEAVLQSQASGFGPLMAVRHAAVLSATPARWVLPAMPLGSHPPEWLPALGLTPA